MGVCLIQLDQMGICLVQLHQMGVCLVKPHQICFYSYIKWAYDLLHLYQMGICLVELHHMGACLVHSTDVSDIVTELVLVCPIHEEHRVILI